MTCEYSIVVKRQSRSGGEFFPSQNESLRSLCHDGGCRNGYNYTKKRASELKLAAVFHAGAEAFKRTTGAEWLLNTTQRLKEDLKKSGMAEINSHCVSQRPPWKPPPFQVNPHVFKGPLWGIVESKRPSVQKKKTCEWTSLADWISWVEHLAHKKAQQGKKIDIFLTLHFIRHNSPSAQLASLKGAGTLLLCNYPRELTPTLLTLITMHGGFLGFFFFSWYISNGGTFPPVKCAADWLWQRELMLTHWQAWYDAARCILITWKPFRKYDLYFEKKHCRAHPRLMMSIHTRRK